MSDRLFRWIDNKTRAGTFVGVVVERMQQGVLHVGLIYRTETSGGPFVLHLMGHRKLVHDAPVTGQVCVLPPIDPVRLPSLAALARRIYIENRDHGIPYAFSSPDHEWFTPLGHLVVGPDQLGLTCANFVLAVYRAAGLPLVKLETWPVREEDKEWQSSVVEYRIAAARGNTKKLRHVQRMKKQIGTVRCRPFEVGGAALSDQIPCAFPEALENSNVIEQMLPP